ncbi:uncharacterized protein EDB91DRAFT_1186300 [Suillus paluster]|uniref:uncharacterized protein n=1 Tax=Suillus paluster TaxID=48578 RepID=UPI001B863522|nr:uncharacterized protein EDB91DRAFT_1186300 [Suillus paluster]KAG1718242.1 hypothetical protein EDB91DRAFT_1186300 [Suillus paluster]
MKYISLATLIMSAAVIAGTSASDTTPIGGACKKIDKLGCGLLLGFNNENSFLYYCGSDGTIQSFVACSCLDCCTVTGALSGTCT